jgi:hypothetical protein
MPSISGLALQHDQERQHLDRLPEAHVVGQAGAEAEPVEEVEPADSRLLARPERGAQRLTRLQLREALRPAEPLERAREPRPGHDTRSVGIRGRPLVLARPARPGQHPQGLGEADAGRLRLPLHPPELVEGPAQAVGADLNRFLTT